MDTFSAEIEDAFREFWFFSVVSGSLIFYYLGRSTYTKPWAIVSLICTFYRLLQLAYLNWSPVLQSEGLLNFTINKFRRSILILLMQGIISLLLGLAVFTTALAIKELLTLIVNNKIGWF